LKKAIGMALIDSNSDLDTLEISVHSNMRKIRVIPKPFYKKQK
jgi:glycine cleavage system aminomethyltransferase T